MPQKTPEEVAKLAHRIVYRVTAELLVTAAPPAARIRAMSRKKKEEWADLLDEIAGEVEEILLNEYGHA